VKTFSFYGYTYIHTYLRSCPLYLQMKAFTLGIGPVYSCKRLHYTQFSYENVYIMRKLSCLRENFMVIHKTIHHATLNFRYICQWYSHISTCQWKRFHFVKTLRCAGRAGRNTGFGACPMKIYTYGSPVYYENVFINFSLDFFQNFWYNILVKIRRKRLMKIKQKFS